LRRILDRTASPAAEPISASTMAEASSTTDSVAGSDTEVLRQAGLDDVASSCETLVSTRLRPAA
jgi:hypothetical protein